MSPCAHRPALGWLLAVVIAVAVAPGCREEGTIRVTSITFQGARHVDPKRLKSVIVTKESSRLPWGRTRYFDRKRFDADTERIRAFYVDRGYPDAHVAGVDVQLNAAQDAVQLTVRVDEGEPVLVDAVQFEGFESLSERAHRRLNAANGLVKGQPLDRQVLAAGREAASGVLKDNGYPYAVVEARTDPNSSDAHHVSVTYVATPGPLARIGPVSVAGNTSVDDQVITRQLAFKPGDVYRRSQVLESQRRLYNLELFQFANVEPEPGGGQPTTLPMRVTVAEGKHRRLNFGVGYGTEEKARVDARWQHANFFGGARTAGLAARWSSLDRGVKADFTEPYFLSSHFSLGFSAQAWNTVEPLYSLDALGGRVTLTHRANRRTSWSVGFVNEYQRSTVTEEGLADPSLRNELIALGLDPVDGRQAGTVRGFEFDVQRNTTPRLVDARRGYYAALHLEQSGGWLPGAFDYYSGTLDLRKYVSLPGRAVLAARGQVGIVDALGHSTQPGPDGEPLANIPFAKRFFLGGSTSLRGWGRFDVAPLSGSGQPIGGLSMMEMSTELRVPVRGPLSVVVFADAGNVWADSWQLRFSDLRYDIGPGVRYVTPIGPVRADFGYQLNPIPGLLVNGEPETRHWRVHFSIGQAF
jgi:outer membrane protein assembly complex protein YaeT